VTYSLPAEDIPPDVRERLHPWIAGFIGLSPAEATQRLHARWASIERPSLVALRKTLSEFEVLAIVDCPNGGMIYAERPDADVDLIGNSFLLPAAIDADELSARLEAVSLSQNDSVREFLAHFAGLSEQADEAGNFVYLESPWPNFTDSWNESIVGFDEWKDSLMIYNALNGCHVLVRPDGKVGWWVMQERLVQEESQTFDEFIGTFNKHRKIAWPFDPYGAPD
jgi:hypothetical protein